MIPLTLLAGLALAQSDSEPAQLVRCSTRLSGPDGRAEVWGVGLGEADAAQQARQLAWTVAALQQSRWIWSDILGWQDTRVAQRFASWAPEQLLDGVEFEAGDCEPLDAHDPGWPRGWVATTLGVSVTRADPLVAARAARREACFGDWNRTWEQALWAASAASGRARNAALTKGADAATEALLGCLATKPVLTRQGALPPEAAYTDGPFRCVGAAGSGIPLMAGEGSTLEHAREAARQQGQALEARVAVARGLRAMVERPEARGELFAAALSVGQPPPVDLACVSIVEQGPPRWRGPFDNELCRMADVQLTAPDAPLDDACWAVTAPIFAGTQALFETVPAPEHHPIAAEAWSQVLACHAACRNEASTVTLARPVAVIGGS